MYRNNNIPRRVGRRIAPKRDKLRNFVRSFVTNSTSKEPPYKSYTKKTKPKKEQKKAKKTESYYRDKLAEKLDASEKEVSTPVGKIDILTKNEIIEVKYIKKWKEALGQIISYGKYYPNRQKRIHLFGGERDFTIERNCLSSGVSVSWEEDESD